MNGKRSKKLLILGGALCAACLVTLILLGIEQKQEDIRTSGEVILEIPSENVTAVSWTSDQKPSLSLHRESGHWIYDDDEAFPVNDAKIQDMLEQFESLAAAFIIEKPESLSAYGLDDPVAEIKITTDDDVTYAIELGAFSTMDEQRYISIGDGNVYLLEHDPFLDFDVFLSDLILHDQIPHFDQIQTLEIQGPELLSVTYAEEGGPSLREADHYFTRHQGQEVPLDTGLVEGFLQDLSWVTLQDFVTYHVTDAELADYGLDKPQLTVTVTYMDDEDVEQIFSMEISRDPAEIEAAKESDEEEDEEEITAYARLDDSPIIYQISGEDYHALMACTYNDLRHHEVLPAAYDSIAQLDVELDGAAYTFLLNSSDEEQLLYRETEFDETDIRNALTAMMAQEFTDVSASGKTEISMTLTLNDDAATRVSIALDRYDGTRCLAMVDGRPFALVDRGQVVDLMEAVHAIVLDTQTVEVPG